MLETERLLLRRWRQADGEPFYRINSDPRVMEFLPACLTREESDALIRRAESHWRAHGFGPFAAELRGTGQFDHPELPEGHPLRRHVLYRKRAPVREGLARVSESR